MKYTADEQFRKQYLELIKRHIIKRLSVAIICVVIGITLICIGYIGYKDIITMKPFTYYMIGLSGIGAIIIAIHRLIYKTYSEQQEIDDLKLTYTQERFKERNG